jgi:hypothetical protein
MPMKSIFNKLVGDRKQDKTIKVGDYNVHIVKQIAEGMGVEENILTCAGTHRL